MMVALLTLSSGAMLYFSQGLDDISGRWPGSRRRRSCGWAIGCSVVYCWSLFFISM